MINYLSFSINVSTSNRQIYVYVFMYLAILPYHMYITRWNF